MGVAVDWPVHESIKSRELPHEIVKIIGRSVQKDKQAAFWKFNLGLSDVGWPSKCFDGNPFNKAASSRMRRKQTWSMVYCLLETRYPKRCQIAKIHLLSLKKVSWCFKKLNQKVKTVKVGCWFFKKCLNLKKYINSYYCLLETRYPKRCQLAKIHLLSWKKVSWC